MDTEMNDRTDLWAEGMDLDTRRRFRCVDCGTSKKILTCDDRKIRCAECAILAGYCATCGTYVLRGVCDICSFIVAQEKRKRGYF